MSLNLNIAIFIVNEHNSPLSLSSIMLHVLVLLIDHQQT